MEKQQLNGEGIFSRNLFAFRQANGIIRHSVTEPMPKWRIRLENEIYAWFSVVRQKLGWQDILLPEEEIRFNAYCDKRRISKFRGQRIVKKALREVGISHEIEKVV